MSDTKDKGHIVKNSHSLSLDAPAPPSDYTGQINAFGFPVSLKQVHKSLKQIINKIPFKDDAGLRTRDMFLTALDDIKKLEPDVIDALCHHLAVHTATNDLLEKRISTMTPADYMVDKKTATPDQGAVSDMRRSLLQEDNERLAKTMPVPGKTSNEWAHLDIDDPSSPGW